VSNSSQQIGFFAALAFALQIGQNHGLQLFCPASQGPRFCKNLLCPFLRARPPLFCPLSPEAYLLTKRNKTVRIRKQDKIKKTKNGCINEIRSYYNPQNKSASARQKSGPGSMACGGKHFFVLMFGYFASKVK
jgi:hypothetical protein